MKAATNFFLLIAQPPKHIEPEQISPRRYVFIVDVSGSMNGFPLDISKELLRKLIARICARQSFNVVLFAVHQTYYPSVLYQQRRRILNRRFMLLTGSKVEATWNCYRRCNARSL